MSAVTTPVATPREKEPLKTPRNIPRDLSSAMASKVWLLSPCGWYATIDLKYHRKQTTTTSWRQSTETVKPVHTESKTTVLRVYKIV